MLKCIVLCLGLGLLYSCSSGNKKQFLVPDINIEEADDIVFALDDSTVQNMEYLQLFQRNDSDILAFTNEYDNAIVFYDYKTRKYLGRTEFAKEGNNGIGTIFSFYYLNQDSIYLYNFTTYSLFLANARGEVVMKKDLHTIPNLSKDSLFFAPQLFPRTNSPLRKIGDELLIAGFFMNEQAGENSVNRPVMAHYDLSRNTLRFSDSYPSMYHKGNWGGDFTYRNPFYTLSPKNEIVLGFAADHNIRVHGKDEMEYHEYYAGVGGDFEITPIAKDIAMNTIAREIVNRHYTRTLSYQAIVYDKYRKVFYRFALMPDDNIKPFSNNPHQSFSIIILNKDYEIIGETKFPGNTYTHHLCFVGKKGLYISENNENNPQFDENKLVFRCFTLQGRKK